MKKASLYFLCLILIIAVAVSCGGGGGGGGGAVSFQDSGAKYHNGGGNSGWGAGNQTGNGLGGSGGLGSGGDSNITITGGTPLHVERYVYNGTTYNDKESLLNVLGASTLPDSFNIDFYVEGETSPRTARVSANGTAGNGNDIFIEHQYKAFFPNENGGIEEVLFYKRDGIVLPGDPAGIEEDGFIFETNWNIGSMLYPCGQRMAVNTSGDIDYTSASKEIAPYGFKEDYGDYILGFRSSPAPTGTIAINTDKVIKQVKSPDSGSVILDFSNVTFKNNEVQSSFWNGNFDTVSSVILPANLTSVGYAAFQSRFANLESVTIPNNVNTIGTYAFKGLDHLQTVNITGNALNSIGDEAFSGCSSLESFTMPNSVQTLGERAFWGCSSLESLTLSNNLQSIPDYAFYGCSSLDSTLDIPASVTAIGNSAFQDCSSIDTLTLHSGLTAIGDNAFQGCSDLDAVSIPNGVTTIGTAAFLLCSDLAQISIPPSVNSIGNSAFNSVKTDCVLTINNNGTPITLGGPLALPNSNFSVNLTGSSIPMQTGGTQSIFDSNTNLTEITLADSVSAIPANAFNGCSDLTNITISSNIDSIGAGAFNGTASGITITFEGNQNIPTCNLPDHSYNVVLKNGVPKTGSTSIFQGDTNLTELVFQGGQLGMANSFKDCSSLTTVTFNSYPSVIGSSVFRNCPIHNIIFEQGLQPITNVSNLDILLNLVSNLSLITVTFKNSSGSIRINQNAFNFTGANTMTYEFDANPNTNMTYDAGTCFRDDVPVHATAGGTTYTWDSITKSWQ